MRYFTATLSLIVGCALAACTTAAQNANPPVRGAFVNSGKPMARQAPDAATIGVYVSEVKGELLEYNYEGKGSPLCTLRFPGYINAIQSDSENELIVTTQSAGVNIYKETRHLCVSSTPIKQFPNETALDGFSLDGKTYYFAENEQVDICKLGRRPGCRRHLTNYYAQSLVGITADASGVYASSYETTGASLLYWQGATGPGIVLGGYVNRGPGGLYFDGFGNLLAIDSNAIGGPALYVYSGCPSACHAHGPFSLGAGKNVAYGSLGNGETRFMALNENGSIDVYQYNGTYGLTYLYSNSAGLNPSASPIGIAQILN